MSDERNLYISYLDEAKVEDKGPMRKYTIASMTASKKAYVEDIEQKWKIHRDTFGIPKGKDIHFTKIKHLLNQNPPVQRPHDPDWVRVFSDGTEIDFSKLHAFFLDSLTIIREAPFIVQITGLDWDSRHFCRNKDVREHVYFPPFITFREHMDLMGIYLLGGHLPPFHLNNIKITKLRYDGDVGLQERDDLKRAYHHTLTVGTRHFKAETAIRLFDEIRFIGKHEIGHDGVTHAGSEIIDLITTMAARDMWQIDTHKIKISVPGIGVIDPLPFIKPKILHAQKLQDFFC